VCLLPIFFGHDVNFCPHYDVFDESYATFNAMIEIMNKQHKNFVIKMSECSILHESKPSLPFHTLEASLCDACESSFPLESIIVVDVHLTDLEVELEPPLTSLPFCCFILY